SQYVHAPSQFRDPAPARPNDLVNFAQNRNLLRNFIVMNYMTNRCWRLESMECRNGYLSLLVQIFCMMISRESLAAQSPPSADDPVAARGPCNRSEIRKTVVPVYPDRKNSPTFSFSFFVQKGTRNDLPTVLFLPGGPGGLSIIGADYADKLFSI